MSRETRYLEDSEDDYHDCNILYSKRNGFPSVVSR